MTCRMGAWELLVSCLLERDQPVSPSSGVDMNVAVAAFTSRFCRLLLTSLTLICGSYLGSGGRPQFS
jgi:hypothetical protein